MIGGKVEERQQRWTFLDQAFDGLVVFGRVFLGECRHRRFRRGDAGELVPVDAEQEAIREMAALRGQGKALTFRMTILVIDAAVVSFSNLVGVGRHRTPAGRRVCMRGAAMRRRSASSLARAVCRSISLETLTHDRRPSAIPMGAPIVARIRRGINRFRIGFATANTAATLQGATQVAL
jgi:hypothetical protein